MRHHRFSLTTLRLALAVVGLALLAAVPALAGSLEAWGYNDQGQCTPIPSGNTYTAVAAGGFHSLALKSDGSLVGWGWNPYGQISVPVGTNYTAIAAGLYHSVALKSDGSLAAWGYDGYGQIDVPAGTNYTAIAAGDQHNVALKSDGSLAAWGSNNYGERDVPSGTNYVAVAAGGAHSVALKSDGSLTAWGDDTNGQTDVPAGTNFTAIAAGGSHCLALKSDGSLVAWGNNTNGQCNVPAGTNFTAIAAGGSHSLALKSDGSMVAWGSNSNGQCNVPAGIDYTVVSAGYAHNVVIKVQTPHAPVNISVTPSTGAILPGVPTTISCVYRDANGFTDLLSARLLINDTLTGFNSVTLVYVPQLNRIYLRKDDGNLSYCYAPGTNATLSNSECDLDVHNTTVSGSGTDLTVNWRVTLKSPFSSKALSAYMYVQDQGCLSDGWDKLGTYFIPVAPTCGSLSPNSGVVTTGVPQTYTAQYSDLNGYNDVRMCYLQLSVTGSQANAVLVKYDRLTNRIYLKNNANTLWSTGYAPGTGVTLSNSQCTVDVGSTTATPVGLNGLGVSWSITLKATQVGKHLCERMYVQDNENLVDGWNVKGYVTAQ